VAAEHEPSLELEQEVLADGADALEPKAVQPLGQPEDSRPRVRSLDGEDLAFENPQPRRGAVEGITLGHQMLGR
jgi:hypothetical protein